MPETVRVGILISLFGVVNGVLAAGHGALSDRMARRKPIILVGLAVMAAATSLFAFAASFWHLLLLRCAQGVGVAMTIPAVMALMTAATASETRGGAMGVYTSMRMVGFAGGPLIGGLLCTTGWASTPLSAPARRLDRRGVRARPVPGPGDARRPGDTRAMPFAPSIAGCLRAAILGLGLADPGHGGRLLDDEHAGGAVQHASAPECVRLQRRLQHGDGHPAAVADPAGTAFRLESAASRSSSSGWC